MGCEEILCDANHLRNGYLASVSGSKWKEPSQAFMIHYLKYLFRIQEKMQNQTLTNDPVNEFPLSERGKTRIISSLSVKDRIIRHVLCDELLTPAITRKIIYDNSASIKGRGMAHARKRFEVHLHRYFQQYGNEGGILIGDFSKFYDNIWHDVAKDDFLRLFEYDLYLKWLLDVIFDGFRVDVSYMTDEEYATCMTDLFNRMVYREIPKELLTGEKFMEKSVNIGDQLSQNIGVYYPNSIDTYVKYVRSQKFYGRYMDDFYIMSPDKELLKDILAQIECIAESRGMHLNRKKTRITKMSSVITYLQVRYTLTKTGKVYKRINPKRVTAMRQKLKKLRVKVDMGEIQYEQAEQVFRSWMGSFYKLLSKTQRENLIQLYEDLYDKEVALIKKNPDSKWKMIITDRED